MSNPKATAANTSFIDPDRLYSYNGFVVASGITKTRVYQTRREGHNLRHLMVGRRMFIRGRDAIAFIESIAEEVDS